MNSRKYTFGPVPSRRLGMSLGVDIVPFKTCTFNCVYCQLGVTTTESTKRQSFVPKEEVLDELRRVVSDKSSRIDFITFSGSGEPTLNSDIGDIIHSVKTFTRIPVAVITNGSLLYREDVRRDLMEADLVVPSLDALTQESFEKVNRPHTDLDVKLMVEGLEKFTQEFKGQIWLEIMIVRDINDDLKELKQIADLVSNMKIDKIQLNTVARPPAEDFAMAINAEEMQNIAALFGSRGEVIVDFDKLLLHETGGADIEDAIISLLKRRPCTADDISKSLSIHINEAMKHVSHLIANGSIRRVKHQDKWYYERKLGN